MSELMEIGDPRDEDVTDRMELSNHEGDLEEVSLETVDITTLVNSGGIQGVGEDNYVPFMNVLPDDDDLDGMPDGVYSIQRICRMTFAWEIRPIQICLKQD